MSLDGVAEIARFHEEQHLNFPLLSDPDGTAARRLGVELLSFPGVGPVASRVTVVVDARGRIRAVTDEVDVVHHGADLVRLLHTLGDPSEPAAAGKGEGG